MTIIGAILVLLLAVLLAPTSGFFRVAVAVLMAAIILGMGLRALRKYRSIPPDPELADVGEYGLKYVCSVCGLELKIEVAAQDKAPTHCHEPMVLVRTGGKPPLRPL
ncbi:MAG: hypothetical protein ACRDJI_07920 [Actinomycetota bacterium]